MTERPEASPREADSPPKRRRRRWRYLRRLLVLGVLLLSVLLVGVRYLLVEIAGREGEVAAWLGAQIGAPVTLQQASGSWSGWAPSLRLRDVRIGPVADELKVGEMTVSLDPWRSLKARELLPDHLAISGVDIVIRETPLGHWQVQGLPADAGTRGADLGRWHRVLKQLGTVAIEADRIRIESPRLSQALELNTAALQLASIPAGLSVQLEARLAAPLSGGLRLRLDWDGSPGQLLYAHFEDLRLGELSEWLGQREAPASGLVDVRLWLPIAATVRQPYVARVNARDLRGRGLSDANLSELELTLSSPGQGPDGFTPVDYRVDRAVSGRGTWPTAAGRVRLEGGPEGLRAIDFTGSFLRLDDLWPGELALGAWGLPGWTQLRGDLSDVALHHEFDRSPREGLRIAGNFHGLGLEHSAGRLHAGALSGQFAFDRGQGRIELRGSDLSLSLPSFPDLPPILSLDARLGLAVDSTGWQLSIHALDLLHPALAAGLTGRIGQRDAGAPPELKLLLSIERGELDRLDELLPSHPALAAARTWMDQRLIAGRITHGQGLLRGPLTGWPYADGSGHAELILGIEAAKLRFNDEWPAAVGLKAELALRGTRFELAADQASLLDARLSQGSGVIEDIRAAAPWLDLGFELASDGPGTKALLNASPLKDGPGRRLARIDIDGPLRYQMKLRVPLFKGPVTTIDGRVHFANNRINVAQDVELTELRGPLDFTRTTWGGRALAARHTGRPVLVSAGSVPDIEGGGSRITLSGRMDRDYLAEQMARHADKVYAYFQRHTLWPRVSGETDFLAEVRIPPREAPRGAETEFTLTSSLTGLALDLPAPLGKPAAAALPLRLATGLDSEPAQRLVRLEVGPETQVAVRLTRPPQAVGRRPSAPPRERDFYGADLALGGRPAQVPETRGIAVHGEITHFRLSDWLAVLSPPASADAEYDDSLDPVRLNVRVADLEAYGQRFPAMTVTGQRQDRRWQLRVDSLKTRGSIDWPLKQGEARFRFEQLSLNPDPEAASADEDDSDPSSLPAIDATAGDFTFAGNQLGRLALKTEPSSDGRGLTLKQLHFESERFTAEATGRWHGRGRGQESDFDIKLRSPDLGHLLGSFGYSTAAIEGGQTEMAIDARWPGGPDDFRLEILNGELELRIKYGRLLEVDPRAGRLFGLLSLQTLPRRLALDFGDVFGKGFGFDSIDGRFQIVAGNAHTDNLTMIGPAARIEVSGRTGLAARDYDQRVVVIPALSSNLPVASALFGPVGIGVGAALYLSQQVFRELPGAIDSLLSQHYTVTGPWDEPVITRQTSNTARSGSG